jgi:xanthine dehydrogenase accessory factor
VSTQVFTSLATAARSGENVALGVLTSVKGSSPQKAGALAVFHADGRIDGTLGGGCLEAEAGKLALESLASGKAVPFDVVLDGAFRWDDGMICGGRMGGWVIPAAQQAGVDFWETLAAARAPVPWGITSGFAFISGDAARRCIDDLLHHAVVTPPITLWIAGAGHIAQAVAPLAFEVGFDVHVFDDREELASRYFFREPIALKAGPWPELLALDPPSPAFALILTRGHEHDAQVLRAWLPHGFGFLGMIGSKRKARLMREAFLTEGTATGEQMDTVECPVGIEIEAVSPKEIAVSIVARLIERRATLTAA